MRDFASLAGYIPGSINMRNKASTHNALLLTPCSGQTNVMHARSRTHVIGQGMILAYMHVFLLAPDSLPGAA